MKPDLHLGQSEHVLKAPDKITVCAKCGYDAWRQGYPCNRCGGLQPRIYAPVDEVTELLEAASVPAHIIASVYRKWL